MAFNLGLRILGTGTRDTPQVLPQAEAKEVQPPEILGLDGSAPAVEMTEPWDGLQDPEVRDFAAFSRAGWEFTRQEEGPVPQLGIDGIEKGLLAQHPEGGLVIVRDRLVVGLAEGADVAALKARYRGMQALSFGRNVHQIPFELPQENVAAAVQGEREKIEELLGSKAVRFVDPVLLYNVEPPPMPSPPLAVLDDNSQWQWRQIKLPEAFALTEPKPGDGTRVAVIDRGFFESSQLTIEKHVDHLGTPITEAMEDVWHGTFCAALVGGTRGNHFGNGASPNCRVILVAVGHPVSSVALAEALKTSTNCGADVISCSIAPVGRAWDKLDTLIEAVEECERSRAGRGTLIVWAVFNVNRKIDPGSLEAHPFVVCVAPSDRDDVRTPASGFGVELDLIAPGVAVPGLVGTDNTNARLSAESGASFAAPCVAGVASLALSVNPGLTSSQLRKLLRESADPVIPGKRFDPSVGWGRLNALQALTEAKALNRKP